MGRGPRKRKAQSQGEAAPAAASSSRPKAAAEGRSRGRAAACATEEEEPENEEPEEEEEEEASEEEGPPDSSQGAQRVSAWAEDSKRQERWLASRGGSLEPRLAETPGGMLFFRDFMPQDVADSVLAVLEGLPEDVWELSEQAGEHDAARHRFWSADVCDVPALGSLRSVFWRMLPSLRGEPTLPIFSCARYGKTDFIGRHDDRAHVPVFGLDKVYSRTAAAVWYLTRDWTEEDGGCLLDLRGKESDTDGIKHVPTYNSLVVFEVPHWHAVTPISSERYRYSIFGWWHQPGERYELPGGAASASAAAGPRKKRKAARSKPGA